MRRRTAVMLLWILTLALPSVSRMDAQDKDKKEGPPQPKFKVGDMAPDFTLSDQNGTKVTLSSFRGKKNVALAFYIFAFTGG